MTFTTHRIIIQPNHPFRPNHLPSTSATHTHGSGWIQERDTRHLQLQSVTCLHLLQLPPHPGLVHLQLFCLLRLCERDSVFITPHLSVCACSRFCISLVHRHFLMQRKFTSVSPQRWEAREYRPTNKPNVTEECILFRLFC